MTASDPVQWLIDAGAIPSSPFGPTSRYAGVPVARHAANGAPYLLRRFIAQPARLPASGSVTIASGDRPDLLAARTLGQAALYWRIADANAVVDPCSLTDTPGARVRIPE